MKYSKLFKLAENFEAALNEDVAESNDGMIKAPLPGDPAVHKAFSEAFNNRDPKALEYIKKLLGLA